MTPTLIAIAGPLRGTHFQLAAEELTIGRHPSNQLRIADPSVSRHHCAIRMENGSLSVRDLGSNNGTFVNGKPVQEAVLRHGDEISIGEAVLRLITEEESGGVEGLPLDEVPWVAGSTVQLSKGEALKLTPGMLLPAEPSNPRAARDLKALLEIGGLFHFTADLNQLQLELLQLIAGAVPAQAGAIILAGYSYTEAKSIFGWDRRTGAPAAVPVSRTVIEQVLGEGVSILSNDILHEGSASGAESLVQRQVTSVLAVPLLVGGRAHGALYLETCDRLRQFDENHFKLVIAISGFAALALDHARRIADLHSENHRLREQAQLKHNLVGDSEEMRAILQRISKVAPTDATVLILGETGTGKELVAGAIHQNSPRYRRPFEAINCSMLKETLLESELLGHERGAFTGAVAQKKGKLELADGGTVFLDEIGELPEPTQAMLLRVLQDRSFKRLGGLQNIAVNIRLIAATNKNLEEAIRNKTFREDLYYRLNVVTLRIPPLRERRGDIPLLADHFARESSRKNKRMVAGVSPEARALLMNYEWPGNVRELQNAIEYAVVFGSADEIMPEDLPEKVIEGARRKGACASRYHDAVRRSKEQIVLSALEKANGNFTEAAELLDIHVNNLHRLVRELNLRSRISAAQRHRAG